MQVKVLSARFDIPDAHKIEVAKEHGAYSTLEKVFSMQPEEIIELVKASGLRGRGFGFVGVYCQINGFIDIFRQK